MSKNPSRTATRRVRGPVVQEPVVQRLGTALSRFARVIEGTGSCATSVHASRADCAARYRSSPGYLHVLIVPQELGVTSHPWVYVPSYRATLANAAYFLHI